MSNEFTLKAEVRTKQGKGAARRARAAGGVPAVVYGPGQPGLSIVVQPKEMYKAVTGPKRRNALLTLDLKDGANSGKRTVMVKELQIHPVKRTPTHVDFLEVKPDQLVAVSVPLEVMGKSKAITQGAKLTLIARTVKLEVKAAEVPEKVIFDVTEEGFGVIRAKQLKVPAGTRLLDTPETPLVSIKIPRGDKEEEAAATPAEGAAAPAGDKKAAAPAAEAKAGDKKK
jgi:large subunit ribosomal protein L25